MLRPGVAAAPRAAGTHHRSSLALQPVPHPARVILLLLEPRLFHTEPRGVAEVQMDPKALWAYQQMQRNLLHQAVALLQPGGTLVYSTCTINPGDRHGVPRGAL
jgi:hypothetical protein